MIKPNALISNGSLYRVLGIAGEKVLVIDCLKKTMPVWKPYGELENHKICSEEVLAETTGTNLCDFDTIDSKSIKTMRERYTLIAPILPYILDDAQRSEVINQIHIQSGISRQTIRKHLIQYLIYQDVTALSPRVKVDANTELTKDQKNIRWGLNKFFYSQKKNSLKTAYTLMLREKYCDELGQLQKPYPSFGQFRYYYRKHKDLRKYYISRGGIKEYQKNHRPLLGDGVQSFAPNIGTGMLDSTICDIYLVNDAGELIGRPILTACVDAYSSLCCGYALSWEGGVYSIKELLLNTIADKVDWCKRFGISIDSKQWPCNSLPAVMVTDRGSEYKSEHFEQITELGVKVINLPAYRAELKGPIEKFFDCIQDLYKPYLKGKGVVEPDFQQRGAHDYRIDARLTLNDFERILLHCIVFYNSQRVIENFPYSEQMIQAEIAPTSAEIWNWGLSQPGANLIKADMQKLSLLLLPRTEGKFERTGLKVNGLRYRHPDYSKDYLTGKLALVAYNPDNASYIWLIENGKYVEFDLIETRFQDKSLATIADIKQQQKRIAKTHSEESLQAKIDLINHIATIADGKPFDDVQIRSVRSTRKKERDKAHKSFQKDGDNL